MKKKIWGYGLLILFIIALLGGGFYYFYKKNKDVNQIKKIQNQYHEVVTTTNIKKIYVKKEDEYKIVGSIGKGVNLHLKEKKVKNTKDTYFQILDSNYYIDYLDIENNDSYYEDISIDHYLSNKIIKSVSTKLYKDQELAFELDESHEFDVLLVDNDKYYIKFLSDIYYIKDNYQLIDKKLDVSLLDSISVLRFDDNISISKLEEVLKHLSENKYSSITLDDFKLWIGSKVQLESNKVLLVRYKDLDEEQRLLVDKYKLSIITGLEDIKLVSGDVKLKVGDEVYYNYNITSTTTLNRVKDMLNGVKEIKTTQQSVAVLNYHFFYDGVGGEGCNESICLDISNFKKQLDYLKNNNYKTLTMKEFNDWMDKKITIPEKSVLLTIDDGAMGTNTHLIRLLEEYKMNATLFLITGWWSKDNYQSSYLGVESHGYELHHDNYCDQFGCGYKTLKLSKDAIMEDLKKSTDILGTSLAFCYPFYRTNQTLVSAVKDSGFKLAFVGGNNKAKQSSNKYYIPRYVVYKNTSLDSFIKMIK